MLKFPDELLTGIKSIDEHHMALFYRIDKMMQAKERSDVLKQVNNVIEFVKKEISLHYRDEENYMKMYSYPGYDEHKKAHKKFEIEFFELLRKVEEDKFVQLELNKYLRKWLVEHVNNEDIKMAEFLRKAVKSK